MLIYPIDVHVYVQESILGFLRRDCDFRSIHPRVVLNHIQRARTYLSVYYHMLGFLLRLRGLLDRILERRIHMFLPPFYAFWAPLR